MQVRVIELPRGRRYLDTRGQRAGLGETLEIEKRDEHLFLDLLKWVEEIDGKDKHKPKEAEAQRQVGGLEDYTREELLQMAEERGIELPSGYVKKDELVELLKAG